ncbi:MAG: hypothetical protein IKV61_05295 [Clostridia bacterium]|nr:hypothetical protein [Clostridia bacterium]
MIDTKAGENARTLNETEVNTLNDAHTAEAEEDLGAKTLNKYGKFNSLESLVDAYNSLQSEFTRRCQKVKELEREIEISKTSNQPKTELEENDILREKSAICSVFPQTKDMVESLVEIAEKNGDNQNGRLYRAYAEILLKEKEESEKKLNSLEFLSKQIELNPTLYESVIRSYLERINNQIPSLHLTSGNGTAFITPPSKPKTLTEAGNLAKEILDKHKEYNNL